MTIWHISDLHIHTMDKNNKKVKDKLDDIAGMFIMKKDVLVITGDITDDGGPVQYDRAYDLLKRFKGHCVLVPGNHDYGFLGNFYTWGARRRWKKFVKKMQPITELEQYVFIPVDSCTKTGSPIDFAQGRIGWWERFKLNRKIHDVPEDSVAVVCMHHDPFNDTWYLRLQDTSKFCKIVMGSAKLVLYGHTHKYAFSVFPLPQSGKPVETTFVAAPKFEREEFPNRVGG